MPITIFPGAPGNTTGWGIQIGWSSDFIGPLPSGSFWTVGAYLDSEVTNQWWGAVIPTNTPSTTTMIPGAATPTLVNRSPAVNLRTGDTAWMHVELHSPTALLDSGTMSTTWDNSAGAHNDLVTQLQINHGTGLNSTQQAQLTRVDQATQIPITRPTGTTTVPLSQILAMPTLDALTLAEQTSGPTFGFVGVSVPNAAVGLIVRITTVGAGYVPTTPDSSWYPPDLAVINFFRGSDLVGRIGMHEVSRFVYPLPGAWEWWASLLFGGTIPPDYSIQVTFANGNAGRVYLTVLP